MGQDEMILPVCLACWRRGVSMVLSPFRRPGWPEEECTICHRRTNHGIYCSDELLSRSFVTWRETAGGRENSPRQAIAEPATVTQRAYAADPDFDPFALEDMCDADD